MSTMRRVDQLKVGMLVDLEGDEVADPNDDHDEFEFEYQTVDQVEQRNAKLHKSGFQQRIQLWFSALALGQDRP